MSSKSAAASLMGQSRTPRKRASSRANVVKATQARVGWKQRALIAEMRLSDIAQLCWNARLHFVVERDGDGYHAFSPVLRGLHADGNSPDEAAAHFADVAPSYLKSVLQHNEPLPLGCFVDRPMTGDVRSSDIDVQCPPIGRTAALARWEGRKAPEQASDELVQSPKQDKPEPVAKATQALEAEAALATMRRAGGDA